MNILFICYWGASEGLTSATVLPHLVLLAELPFVDSIVLCTIEREPGPVDEIMLPKVLHVPLRSHDMGNHHATKAADVVRFNSKIVNLVRRNAIDVVICRSSLAGSLGLVAHAATRVPLFVESFEPHVDYAVEAGAWSKHGLKASFLRASEWIQIRTAQGIMPVAQGYADTLTANGMAPERLRVVPCGVPLDHFAFSATDRAAVRKELGFGESITGIYVGKFGGLYYDEEAFDIFRRCFDHLNGFRLILLTPNDHREVTARLEQAGVPRDRMFLAKVPHTAVPRYLSAADFAFALYSPSPSKRALSPIKNGEYWANGLPVLLTEGVGDEADFLERERAGAFLSADRTNLGRALDEIGVIIADPTHRTRIPSLAARHRSFDAARDAYVDFLTPLARGSV